MGKRLTRSIRLTFCLHLSKLKNNAGTCLSNHVGCREAARASSNLFLEEGAEVRGVLDGLRDGVRVHVEEPHGVAAGREARGDALPAPGLCGAAAFSTEASLNKASTRKKTGLAISVSLISRGLQ